MDHQQFSPEAAALIRRDFELSAKAEQLSEKELFQVLADHIAWLMERRMEWLLSLMYRMDIAEASVEAALMPNAPDPANIGLARLVWDRQQARARTKAAYPPEDLGAEWDW